MRMPLRKICAGTALLACLSHGLPCAAELTGAGQTVVVIDSGVAYDHVALADAYQGGWDFTEGDADPYDDPSEEGGHGTLVAGVIHANDDRYMGVAPGADLVALRVVNDYGAVYASWVEDALDWVYENRFSFENPITTVNVSLSFEWNAETTPVWAAFEEELKLLDEAGIFVAVSAGNQFDQYGEAGLAYPAASPHVVPVMSANSNGSLSSYSQRSTTAIAALGSGIVTTLPDYAGNNDGVNDDWRSVSGTSFASPYVAGASVLIREAMQNAGLSDIDRQMIYDHMIATSDTTFDSITEQTYWSLNLDAALAAFAPELPGDFNNDGMVDLADYTVWRNGLGVEYDTDDFEIWNASFGMTMADVAAPPFSTPEPAAAALALALLAPFTLRRTVAERRSA